MHKMIPAIDVPAPAEGTTSRLAGEPADAHRQRLKSGPEDEQTDQADQAEGEAELLANSMEKSVIVHRDENGFGLRVRAQTPVWVEHVHENGAAWRAGVRANDIITKVNGTSVSHTDHRQVVLMFKSCSRFVGLTLASPARPANGQQPVDVAASFALAERKLALNRLHSHLRQASLGGQRGFGAPVDAHLASLRLLNGRPTASSRSVRSVTQLSLKPVGSDTNVSRSAHLAEPAGQQATAQADGQRADFYRLGQSASATFLPANPGQLGADRLAALRSSARDATARQPTVNKRLEVIREFVDTERTHTERLRCLDELFYRPLKLAAYMTGEQLRAVFSCHRTLYKIHRQIYRILLSANYVGVYSEPMIGSALLEIFEGDLRRRLERASCTFCSAQATNVELLNKLTRKDSRVGEFLAQVTSQQMVGRLGIKDLLASCFQRLTKYPLLLESLLKATPTGASIADGQQQQRELEDGRPAEGEEELEPEERQRLRQQERNSRKMLAISLAEEREFIGRALHQSRQILVKVNEAIKVAMSHNKLKEIWKRTDKYPGVPLIDISKQQVVHEGLLTLRLSKRSFDVYVLLLNDYIIILTREGQDKYRLKFFTPEGKFSSSSSNSAASAQAQVYSPVFVIDEHLATRDAATDENGFYLLCKRKDDSRIYEFASRSPAERLKWRDRIQWTIERQLSKAGRRASCESTLTKSSSELSARPSGESSPVAQPGQPFPQTSQQQQQQQLRQQLQQQQQQQQQPSSLSGSQQQTGADNRPQADHSGAEGARKNSGEPTRIEGTISLVEDDGIVMPGKIESSQAHVDQAIQVSILDNMKHSLSMSS